MHLRGPMNISQLAVYQLSDEASKLKKRRTVPFYNRRRALKQQDPSYDNLNDTQLLDKRAWSISPVCSSASAVTSSVTVINSSGEPSAISSALLNTTCIGPLSSSFFAPDTKSTAVESSQTLVASFPYDNCTRLSFPTVTQSLERHRKVASRPTPAKSLCPVINPVHALQGAVGWGRVAYYTSSAPAQATGFSFLANLGDPRESGTFD